MVWAFFNGRTFFDYLITETKSVKKGGTQNKPTAKQNQDGIKEAERCKNARIMFRGRAFGICIFCD